ncbi:unnamed protein product, partial [Iphiclides podalirius]
MARRFRGAGGRRGALRYSARYITLEGDADSYSSRPGVRSSPASRLSNSQQLAPTPTVPASEPRTPAATRLQLACHLINSRESFLDNTF